MPVHLSRLEFLFSRLFVGLHNFAVGNMCITPMKKTGRIPNWKNSLVVSDNGW